MRSIEKKTKMAIIGSGAITEEGYLPVSKMVPNLQITHLVDLDRDRVQSVANRFEIEHHLTDYHDLYDAVDAVIVATPPQSHAVITKNFLEHGVHVLCEKPLAMTVEDARDMVATGEKFQTHLAVGMVRRLAWSAQALKRMVGVGMLGKIKRFDVVEGWEFNWPLRTGHIFRNENSRGVIEDTGPHLFDLLLWILEGESPEIEFCRDDNWGGIEANAEIGISLQKDGYPVSGSVELSFTRRLRNSIRIAGESGCLEAQTVGAQQILFYPSGEEEMPMVIQSQNEKSPMSKYPLGTQLMNFVNSIIENRVDYVPGREALVTMKLIESCYRLRKPGGHSWEKLYLERFFKE